MPTHTLLMGLRASGKSTTAPDLASRLNLPHLDLDDATCAQLGVENAGEAFRTLGEPAFRRAETQALQHALEQKNPSIIALGGGTPTAPGAATLINHAAISGNATAIYFRASPATLAARIAAAPSHNRPSLTGTTPALETTRLHKQRDPLYRTLATHTINADHLTPDQLTDRAATIINPQTPPPSHA